ncbi:DUF1062 domain-containing protein [Chryseobacterium rhizosphaerae]|uniref:DUF1062 domain-containing protein n=1 Tax=Chryseobacterium rhizosphaerae TaxID=395937 RepID=A0ABX9IE70_9FLAO|nr:DUF1062 domain-containing protein [Chryseobacterium rhizosphaerae]REC70470.1 hypothetical protein DRF57_21955 [Chryseobacterium rhizosphaerae]
MSQQYIWEVKAKNTPLLKKKCSHCNSDRFYCSDKFRLNAQKKNIDIWLIYRCVQCKNTFNMTIFSRVRTESISKTLFIKFSENNTETAWEYAFSLETRRKNNVEYDAESVEYDIQHPTLDDILNSGYEILPVTLKSPFDFSLKVYSVIRICLGLSVSKLNQLIEADALSFQGKSIQKSHRIKDGGIVYIDIEKFRNICFENG